MSSCRCALTSIWQLCVQTREQQALHRMVFLQTGLVSAACCSPCYIALQHYLDNDQKLKKFVPIIKVTHMSCQHGQLCNQHPVVSPPAYTWPAKLGWQPAHLATPLPGLITGLSGVPSHL